MSRRVVVTGAAGRLGSRTWAVLDQHGFDVVATDITKPTTAPVGDLVYADLLDPAAVAPLLAEVDAVVHLGNHPGLGPLQPQTVFNNNVAINTNVFQAAAEHRVRQLVFSSTLQMIGSHIDDRTVTTKPTPPRWPIDGTSRPDPSNLYALSKTVSEVMLRFYAERCGIDAVAIRFPLLHNNDDWCRVTRGEETETDIIEGFTGLTYDDAAALILAILQADLPGYRCYAPATSHRHADLDTSDLIETFYPDTTLALADLVDISQIVDETGWGLSDTY